MLGAVSLDPAPDACAADPQPTSEVEDDAAAPAKPEKPVGAAGEDETLTDIANDGKKVEQPSEGDVGSSLKRKHEGADGVDGAEGATQTADDAQAATAGAAAPVLVHPQTTGLGVGYGTLQEKPWYPKARKHNHWSDNPAENTRQQPTAAPAAATSAVSEAPTEAADPPAAKKQKVDEQQADEQPATTINEQQPAPTAGETADSNLHSPMAAHTADKPTTSDARGTAENPEQPNAIAGRRPYRHNPNGRKWTGEEHTKFLEALRLYKRD